MKVIFKTEIDGNKDINFVNLIGILLVEPGETSIIGRKII